MAQLWGGRFTKETDQLVYNFNASISFDQKFYKQDIQGSIAHVSMLGKQGILTEKEMQDIITCLKEIEADVESGKLEITSEYEDIHSFVEANLIDRLGDTGKKLEEEYSVQYLYSDFKKKDGYKSSIRLSSEYNLYRQDYCGCIFSKKQREQEKQKKEQQ